MVWGIDTYSYDSSVCQAAKHFGIMNTGESKKIVVEKAPGLINYKGSNRNGIITKPFCAAPLSFTVRLPIEEPVKSALDPFKLPAGLG
ncbi:vitrin-like [Rhinoderma darwinii]|uniref:vitrin-like n=1 Tax=Rhinoderma darwinii TaxID=43563 RepID=UPI003F675094